MATTANNRFIEIGRIGKPRGLEGVVRFMPNQIFTDDLFDLVSICYMRNRRSDLVPARIEQVYTESKRNQQLFFVKFDMIANRSDAEQAMNRALFVERSLVQEQAVPADEDQLTTGYTVRFNGETFGEVLDVMNNPAHPILEIKHGSEILLVPMVDEFVERIDHENRLVYCKHLDQLTDL